MVRTRRGSTTSTTSAEQPTAKPTRPRRGSRAKATATSTAATKQAAAPPRPTRSRSRRASASSAAEAEARAEPKTSTRTRKRGKKRARANDSDADAGAAGSASADAASSGAGAGAGAGNGAGSANASGSGGAAVVSAGAGGGQSRSVNLIIGGPGIKGPEFARFGNSNVVKPWKQRPKHRFSAVKRGAVSSSKSKLEYDARMARKAAKKKWQEQKNLFIERRRAEAEEAKLKRIEKKRRKQENEFRSAVTQTITNAAKIKKMTKKQLRSIKRTRVDPVTGAVELVSPWE